MKKLQKKRNDMTWRAAVLKALEDDANEAKQRKEIYYSHHGLRRIATIPAVFLQDSCGITQLAGSSWKK